MMAAQRAWAGTCTLLLLEACTGSGEGLDANGRPLAPGDDGNGVLTPDLASIQANVFTPICTQCHVGASAPQGLRLDAASSYASLVGVPSSQVPTLLRVEPGNPDRSYLIQKLEGRAAVGDRMPLGQPALPDATIAVIRQWIVDGAPDTAGNPDALLAVTTASASATEIAVGLTRSVDASLVNATTVLLARSSADASAQVAVQARIGVSPHNDALVLLTPKKPLEPGPYSLTLRGTGAAALADWNGTLIDGDGDGSPGGDWTTTLTIGGAP
jgi:hypothetical protein